METKISPAARSTLIKFFARAGNTAMRQKYSNFSSGGRGVERASGARRGADGERKNVRSSRECRNWATLRRRVRRHSCYPEPSFVGGVEKKKKSEKNSQRGAARPRDLPCGERR